MKITSKISPALKIEDDIKHDLKNDDDHKNWPSPKFFVPNSPKLSQIVSDSTYSLR